MHSTPTRATRGVCHRSCVRRLCASRAWVRVIADVRQKEMKAVIQKLNVGLSYCDAETENDILVVFRLPADSHFHVGDVLDVDLQPRF
jgi:hypothetical protein